jgi:hypothetical protein
LAAVLKGKAALVERKGSMKIAIVSVVLTVFPLGYAYVLFQRDLWIVKMRNIFIPHSLAQILIFKSIGINIQTVVLIGI